MYTSVIPAAMRLASDWQRSARPEQKNAQTCKMHVIGHARCRASVPRAALLGCIDTPACDQNQCAICAFKHSYDMACPKLMLHFDNHTWSSSWCAACPGVQWRMMRSSPASEQPRQRRCEMSVATYLQIVYLFPVLYALSAAPTLDHFANSFDAHPIPTDAGNMYCQANTRRSCLCLHGSMHRFNRRGSLMRCHCASNKTTNAW